MFKKISDFLISTDVQVTKILTQYFKHIAPFKELPFFAGHLTEFTKIILYSLIILSPLLFLKILFPYKRRFTYPILLILTILGICIFAIFLGYMQLLYS